MKKRIEIVSRRGDRSKFIRRWSRRAGLIVGALCIAGSARADYDTNWLTAITINSGWGGSDIRVVPEGEVENPEGCTNPDGYISMASEGHKERIALILSAYLTGREMMFRISGCTVHNRPNIIAVYVH